MFDYPMNLIPDEDTIRIESDDFPELNTFGDDAAEALHQAIDALSSVVGMYWHRGLPIPEPSPARGRPTVRLPAMLAAKVTLQRELAASGLTQVALAARLGIDEKQVRRLLDPNVKTKNVEDLERALAALGKQLRVEVDDLPRRQAA